MLAKILFACAFVSVALAAPRNVPNCDKFPNGTDTKVNWYMCDDIKNDGTIFSMKFQDVNTGKDEYPISLKRPVNVLMDINSPGTFSSMVLDIDIFSWGGFAGCSWHKIPTFGLLSGLDACQNGVPCPVQSGRHTMTVNMDFSKYGKIIGLLTNDSPYQIHYKLSDKSTKKATCAIVQARALTK